ncbi:MAG TPA: diguanylate cyclase [Chloroflexi bacterium]|nr:diguanylate cyclase [Chloroflexota bacterium]
MNQIQLTPVIIPSLISVILGIFSTVILWNRRDNQGAIPLFLLFISISIWSLCYSFEVMAVEFSAKVIWLKLEYFGVAPVTLFWLLFCLRYANIQKPNTKSYFLIFSWIQLTTMILALTNDFHHLLWSNITLSTLYGGVLDLEYGPWFWIHLGFSYLLYLAGFYFLVKNYFNTPKKMRQQVSLIGLAGAIPGIASIIYLSGSNPFPLLDLTSLSFALTGFIIVYVLFFHRFLDIIPIARDTTIENMRDGIIVVDLNDRVVDINPAAEKIINLRFANVVGRPSSEVLSDLVDWISSSKEDSTPVKVLTLGEGQDKKFFVLNLLPLSDAQGSLVGYTVIFHDNTESHTLTKSLEDQADRLVVLYEIGKAITSTLKIDSLLELIYTQLSKVIQSDAYFVALYLPETHQMDIRILYDEGKRYPPAIVDASEGLSSWIVENKKPLLIQDLRKEMDDLPVRPVLVGEKKLSRSWLGVPLLIENNLIGLLAVASYKPNIFNTTDKLFMEQISQQAVLSIQNARHYEEVTRQAKLDSLTGVSNHNHFIEILYQENETALSTQSPLSLIMLDIDHFKLYNDTYGHTIGDQVLRLTVQAIESHIKTTDTVGRWGGEEFGIVLPNATTTQANMVANRIRRTLSELPLFNVEGNTIPKPTISQGIATIPEHTSDVDELVVIADRALYRAKARGRDQVAVGIPSKPPGTGDPETS